MLWSDRPDIGDERAVPVSGTENVAALCAPDQVAASAAEKHVVMVGANQLEHVGSNQIQDSHGALFVIPSA